MLFKLALGSVMRHKWSSIVLLSVFGISSFVLFWIFGFSNNFSASIEDDLRRELGDISYEIDFTDKTKIENSLKDYNLYKISGMRNIKSMMSSKKENGMIRLTEITQDNIADYNKIKLSKGRIPKTSEEIAISNMIYDTKLEIGDSLYVTTFTPDKLVNASKLKVVGIGKFENGSVLTAEGMNLLLNSEKYVNKVLIKIEKEIPTREKAKKLKEEIEQKLTKEGIKVNEVTEFYTELDKQKIMVKVFMGIKVVLLCVMFPLIGAVMGALVWMHSYKRRKEIWTHIAMGFRDVKVIRMIQIEYWIIALCGTIAGLGAGFFTSYLSDIGSSRLEFTFLINMYLTTKISAMDIVAIFAFLFISVTIWVKPPLKKIIKDKPFSY